MSVIRVFALPDLGEGLTESEIVAWHVAPGDTVTLNQHIADVETAKAVVELPSPYSGVVTALHQPEGVIVHVGEPIVSFDVPDSADTETDAAPRLEAPDPTTDFAPAPAMTPATTPATAPVAERMATLVGYGAEAERSGRPHRRPRPGALTRPEPVESDQSGLRETRAPIKGLRKLTAAAMSQSAFTAPHVTEFLTVDVTATLDLLENLERTRSRTGGAHRVGILAVVAQLLCLAVARTPSVNTRWNEASGEIVQFHGVNLGIAAATPRGLIVPVIAHADTLSLAGLAAALADLTAAARAGSTAPHALQGGTITITNIGVFGIDAGTPILNPGEAAILALGAIRRMPWEFHGEVALRSVLTLSLSFDHRLVDGEQGSRFLSDIGRVLTDPGEVLTLLPGH